MAFLNTKPLGPPPQAGYVQAMGDIDQSQAQSQVIDRARVPVPDRFGVPILLAAALGLWGAGVSLPLIQVTKLFLWEDDIIIWRAIRSLFGEGQTVLGLIVLVFTLGLPLAKLISTGFAFRAIRRARGDRALRGLAWIDRFGKWSMLDVFVIAVAIFVAKSGWQAEAVIRPGLYCFAGFAILSSALALRVKHLAHTATIGMDE